VETSLTHVNVEVDVTCMAGYTLVGTQGSVCTFHRDYISVLHNHIFTISQQYHFSYLSKQQK